MTDKLKIHSEAQGKIFCCSATGRQVTVQSWQQFPIPGGQAMWWQCPDCLGWHVVIGERQKDKASLNRLILDAAG